MFCFSRDAASLFFLFFSGDVTWISWPFDILEPAPRNSSDANRQIFAMTSGFLAELPMEAGGIVSKVKPSKFQGGKNDKCHEIFTSC